VKRFGFVTASGLIMALLVPVVSGAAALATGGGIFSAGPLNAQSGPTPVGGAWAHADLACSDCHTPFWSNELMGDRCLACHGDVAQELATPNSLHLNLGASAANCRTCHPEHRGSDSPLTLYEPDLYPHAEFGFFLIAHNAFPDGRPFTCQDCHGADAKFPIRGVRSQYLTSGHRTLGNASYSNSEGCQRCHTNEGFIEYARTGKAAPKKVIANPSEIGCFTCHSPHDKGDFTLRKVDAVKLANGAVFNKGKGNLCANCHQARVLPEDGCGRG